MRPACPSCSTRTSMSQARSILARLVGEVAIVVDDEHASSARSACRSAGRPARRRRRLDADRWQAHDELRAFAQALAPRLERAAVQLDQLARERQADAQARLRARATGRPARTSRRSPRSSPARCRCRCRCTLASTPRLSRAASENSMRPPGSVNFAALLSRLRSTCARRVGSASTVSRLGGSSTDELRGARRASCGSTASSARGGDRAQLDALAPQRELAGGDARDVEQVVDQAHHLRAPGAPSSRARLPRPARRSPASLQDLERVAHRRERVAQLVRERGEELVLAPVGGAQRLLGAAALLDLALEVGAACD